MKTDECVEMGPNLFGPILTVLLIHKAKGMAHADREFGMNRFEHNSKLHFQGLQKNFTSKAQSQAKTLPLNHKNCELDALTFFLSPF